MKTYIKGRYRRSIFESDHGYVIGLFKVQETNLSNEEDYLDKTITFTGYFHELNLEDSYIFYGEEVEHPKYGFQFQVSEYDRIKPSGKAGIVEFLSSDLFPGIGNHLASQIVDTLGDNALDRILSEENVLALVPKLSQKKSEIIVNTLKKYEESHDTIVYLNDLGFSMRDSLLIYNEYKSDTISVLEHNIYELLDTIPELSFLKLDEIACNMGYDIHDENRIETCIIYVIGQLTFKQGDTYLEEAQVKTNVERILKFQVSLEEWEQYTKVLEIHAKLVKEENYLMPMDLYDAENQISFYIHRLLKQESKSYPKLKKELKILEEQEQIHYNEKQMLAITKALCNHVTIITGGPGTGKTTIIRAIVELYGRLNRLSSDALEEQIALLAPTGRASKRMSEATLHGASTIHRFLRWNKENNEFAVNEYYPAKSKLVIVDEVSMIDTMLFYHLTSGLTSNIQLVLVGDYHQLPSVGPGQILKDMIESEAIDVIELDLLYRQDENSYISTLASEIKDGSLSEHFMQKHSDYAFFPCISDMIRPNLKELCQTLLEKGYHEKRVQIMAPMYRGMNGIDELNKEMQAVFNPPAKDKLEIKYGDVVFREHDKVLQLVNMPDENVFNGDIGVISYIIPAHQSKSGKNEIYVDYDGIVVRYLPKDFQKIKHGFVITIHKSQGSEFEIVIMPISKGYMRMLYRKLIYTGVTRAKRKLILLGEKEALLYAVKQNHEYQRKTFLKKRLQDEV